jgi:hypothetical protein
VSTTPAATTAASADHVEILAGARVALGMRQPAVAVSFHFELPPTGEHAQPERVGSKCRQRRGHLRHHAGQLEARLNGSDDSDPLGGGGRRRADHPCIGDIVLRPMHCIQIVLGNVMQIVAQSIGLLRERNQARGFDARGFRTDEAQPATAHGRPSSELQRHAVRARPAVRVPVGESAGAAVPRRRVLQSQQSLLMRCCASNSCSRGALV